nr:unnamed protein product [uncultured Mediterranean phage uvMED]|tara:strand:+ start:507 stop:1082 length:576 start_codon:yes stop_codon:yes gene_type:complete
MGIPFQFTQGDTICWDLPGGVNSKNESVTNADYTCKYYLRGLNAGALTITGTNKGNGWTFELTSTQTSDLEEGKWQYQAVASKTSASDEVTLERGVLTIDQSLVYTGSTPGKIDLRSDAAKMLELVQAAIKAIVTNKAEEYTIGDRTFKYMDMSQLIKLESRYKTIVNREQRADKIKQGKGDPFINKLIFR